MVNVAQAFRARVFHRSYSCLLLFFTLWINGTAISQFEQVQRIDTLTLQYGTDTFATKNAFGGAFGTLVQGTLQTNISTSVQNGSLSLMMKMLGLTDFTGTSEPSFMIGLVNGAPVTDSANPTAYSGASDLDWWYTRDPREIDSNGVPTNQMSASILAKVLNAGPGKVRISSSMIGTAGNIEMSGAFIRANVGASTHPTISLNDFPPGHLPGEHLDTSLQSFSVMNNGKMRGNISAASLASTLLPASLQGSATDKNFSATNTMLDLLVNGAHEFGFILVVAATQPDTSNPALSVGDGPPYKFTVNATTKAVDGALDKNGHAIDLQAALQAAAYSAYFTFTTDRVISPPPPLVSIAVAPRWNLVSVPVTVDNPLRQHLFPLAISKAFSYDNVYTPQDSLRNGPGYWLKFNGAEQIGFSGSPRTVDTISVTTGWNLIGSISTPVPVVNVTSSPGGIVTSKFFGYGGSYQAADTIQPGEGYWTKVNQIGKLILSAAPGASPSERIRIMPTSEFPPTPPDESPGDIRKLPQQFALGQNYPNPFNPTTILSYTVAYQTHVRLSIMNLLGQEVAVLVDEVKNPGFYTRRWDAGGVSSGIYFYRIQAGTFSEVRKLILLR